LKPIQEKLYSRFGTNFALLGDEIYLKAGLPIPSRAHYGSYPQIEDGIGMVRSFHEEFARLLRRLTRNTSTQVNKTPGTILTGTLFAPILKGAIEKLNARLGTKLCVSPVISEYFGGDVSVAGLVTGRDIKSASDQLRGQFVLIPRQMLKSDEAIMLDGTTLAELTSILGVPVYPVNLKELGQFLINTN
jgi:NifB/MoaA-like Fe-S oxidoreductase